MSNHTIIIAEAGVNHNGSIELAKQLIDAAAEAGVDYVKFQTFKTRNLVSHTTPKAKYQKRNMSDENSSQYEMLKKLELSEADHFELIQYCRYKNVKFFSTAFDLDSIDFLASLKLGLWKIPSGEVTNYPYLKKIAKYQESVILSTGMCTISDVETAINVLLKFGANKNQLTLLHCTTEYPTPFNDVNLLAMNVMAQKFGVKVGYSDHTKGIEVPIAAVALGAIVIEKHFTLNRNMEGPDHKASLEPEELTQMVNAIRNVELAISGDGIKAPSESELQNISIVRKSIVAAKKIIKGDVFSEDNLTTKRAGIGISPMMWDEVMGNKAKRDFEEDESIEL